ncbi:hypothetical protein [Fluviicola sp.]|jgi:hypothetical protein|uniref:hypothetical protein n=1 Tax=Fluviicola sp. TaxID=1917219 RepID=UPI00281D3E4A|nr:hypothetical protein [Fluviicola sp.]MDR0801343.1 hypothetical protein [Fluviicola sp.]
MQYNQHLEDLLKKIESNHYVGLGNLNAKILFIGKEPGVEVGSEIYDGTARSWSEKQFDYSKSYIPPKKSSIRNLNHTWQRYQKLYDLILQNLNIHQGYQKKDKYEISFIENVFTTELSNLHAKTTFEAKQHENFAAELEKRKKILFRSNFISQFPIVVIFANDNQYIETYPGEVCELFKVKFDGLHDYSGKDKIWVHSAVSESQPKLLIHTRQLTNSISSELIKNLALLITEFIQKNLPCQIVI